MSEQRQYAEPQGPWSLSERDVAGLRQQLADAERRAQSRDWTTSTRGAEDVKQIRRELEVEELDRARRLRDESRHEELTQHERVEQGAYAAPVSPWATNAPDETPTKPVGNSGNVARYNLLRVRGLHGDVLLLEPT